MVIRFAISLCLVMASCTAVTGRPQGPHEPTVPIEVSAGQTLMAIGPVPCEGIFTYRGLSYLVEIEGCATGYAGAGTVQGLDWPGAIAGDYSREAGSRIWRNQNGVTIELSPPIQSVASTRQLRIYYSGPNLPRQE